MMFFSKKHTRTPTRPVIVRIWNRRSRFPAFGITKKEKEQTCGHVSLEIPGEDGFYASMWPGDEVHGLDEVKLISLEQWVCSIKRRFNEGELTFHNYAEAQDLTIREKETVYCFLQAFHDSSLEDKSDRKCALKLDEVLHTIVGNGGTDKEPGLPDITVVLQSLDVQSMIAEYREFCSDLAEKKWSISASSVFHKDIKVTNCCAFAARLLGKGQITELIPTYNNIKSNISYGVAGCAAGIILSLIFTGGIFSIATLGLMFLGSSTSLLVNATDIREGVKLTYTPDGIGDLVSLVQKIEKHKLNIGEPDSVTCIQNR